MKVLKINNFSKFHLLNNIDYKNYSYSKLTNLYIENGWCFFSGLNDFLNKHNINVIDIFFNEKNIQTKWMYENFLFKEKQINQIGSWKYNVNKLQDILNTILIHQIKKEKPDIIFLTPGAAYTLDKDILTFAKNSFDTKILLHWGDELWPNILYKNFFYNIDYAFSTNKLYHEKFKNAGIENSIVPNYFESPYSKEEILNKSKNKEYQITFCGSSGQNLTDHNYRFEFLNKAALSTDLKIFTHVENLNDIKIEKLIVKTLKKLPLPINNFLFSTIFRNYRFLKEIINIHKLINLSEINESYLQLKQWDKKIDRIFEPKKTIKDYLDLIISSRMVLNIHRDELADYGNIRCFEAVGHNSLLVTDKKNLLKEFFDVENDIFAFQTYDEFLEKYKYFTLNPKEAEKISLNAFNKAWKSFNTNECYQIIYEKIIEFKS